MSYDKLYYINDNLIPNTTVNLQQIHQANPCNQNSRLWHLIYKLQKRNPHKKIIVTPAQQLSLMNYMNGKLYDRKIIKEFIG